MTTRASTMGKLKQRAREVRNLYGRDPWGATGSRVARPLRTNPSMRVHADESSPTMLIAFGGIRGGFGRPLFEFSSLTESMAAKRLFVRDLRQAWYHRGLAGGPKTLLGGVGSFVTWWPRKLPGASS